MNYPAEQASDGPWQWATLAAQISWHGRPARAHGQDGRATLGCGTAAPRNDISS
ncbi:MAG TPA: hypothetical protein VN830_02215 [Verrucomicrobiae bacterium]|nr:hypothetical protein [Verrucomicrobiae bacterium]